MKKWMIWTLVWIAAVLLLGLYVSKKWTPPAAVRQTAAPAQQAAAAKQVCTASLSDVIKAYDKDYGYGIIATHTTESADEIYDLLVDYHLCRAFGSGKVDECEALPDAVNDEKGVSVSETERARCYFNALFLDPGQEGFEQKCMNKAVLEESPVPLKWICSNYKDMSTICEALAEKVAGEGKKISGEILAGCRQAFPSKLQDCSGDRRCSRRFKLYKALSSGHPGVSGLLLYEKPISDAKAGHSVEPCAILEQKIVSLYCNISAKTLR